MHGATIKILGALFTKAYLTLQYSGVSVCVYVTNVYGLRNLHRT